MKNSGKTLTIFLVILLIISLCLASIALYYYQNESSLRKSVESNFEQLKIEEAKLQGNLMESQKQVSLLQEKVKEMDDRVNDLTESVELEKSLKEEQKSQNDDLREALENENLSKERLKADLTKEISSSQERIISLESQLTTAQNRAKELETQSQSLKQKIKQIETEMKKTDSDNTSPILTPEIPMEDFRLNTPSQKMRTPQETKAMNSKQIQLEPIVVAANEISQGRVLSVDKENEFLIFNLGEKNGVKPGSVMSIFRGEDYLGDVKVSRVQPEMSAADFVPPFSSQKVRKNDQVVVKK